MRIVDKCAYIMKNIRLLSRLILEVSPVCPLFVFAAFLGTISDVRLVQLYLVWKEGRVLPEVEVKKSKRFLTRIEKHGIKSPASKGKVFERRRWKSISH